MEAEIHILLDI
jgi:hypothetical protein